MLAGTPLMVAQHAPEQANSTACMVHGRSICLFWAHLEEVEATPPSPLSGSRAALSTYMAPPPFGSTFSSNSGASETYTCKWHRHHAQAAGRAGATPTRRRIGGQGRSW